MFGKCPLFFSKPSQAEPRNSRGYENIQLSAGDESRLQVHFRIIAVHFTGLCYHHGMVQRDACVGALSVGFLCYTLQKQDNRPVYFICRDKFPGEAE